MVLGVVALPDGVALEELAAEVLVGVPLGGLGLVQVDEHRGVGDRPDQQVGEPAQRVLADLVAVRRAVGELGVAVDRDVEVVLPELGHHLQHRPARPDPALQRAPLVVRHHLPAALHAGDLALPQLRGGVRQLRPPGVDLLGGTVVDRGRLQLALEPRAATAGLAHGLRQVGRQPVGEAQREVPVAVGEEGRAVVLATGGVRRRGGRDGGGRGRQGAADEGAPTSRG